MKINKLEMGIHAVGSAIATTVTTAVSSAIGRNWLSVGLRGGLGFGLIQGAIANLVSVHLPRKLFGSNQSQEVFSEFIGGTATCGLSYAAAAIGFIAAPISLPTAAVLTVATIAFKHFFAEKIAVAIIDAGMKAKELINKHMAPTATAPKHAVPTVRNDNPVVYM